MYEYRNYIIRTTFCPFRTVTKSCPVETVPACPVQIRAHRHIAVYIDSNDMTLVHLNECFNGKFNDDHFRVQNYLYCFSCKTITPVHNNNNSCKAITPVHNNHKKHKFDM